MNIPFTDLGILHKKLKKETLQAIKAVIERGDFILGKDTKSFEQEFAAYCNCRYAVGVNSGTDALFLALKNLQIGPGDEVIVPTFTFIATALAVSYTQAKPLFVDIEEGSYNIDPQKIRQAVTKRTKAIIPVHLYGQAANMREILKIAKEYNLKIIEDAAQAHGVKIQMTDVRFQISDNRKKTEDRLQIKETKELKNREANEKNYKKAGAIGDIGCFSFYPTKNLGAFGDAGMLTTNDEKIYNQLLILRDCGRTSKYVHPIIGYNSRLDSLQAAVLRIKLKQLDIWNKLRMEAAKEYDKLFSEIPEIIIPKRSDFSQHIYHVYAIKTKKRDQLFDHLRKKGIGALIHYPTPLHLQGAYKELGYKKGDFPVAEKISTQILSLPIFPYIKSAQIKFIANTLIKGISEVSPPNINAINGLHK